MVGERRALCPPSSTHGGDKPRRSPEGKRMGMRDMAGGLFRWAAGAVVPMFARPVAPVGLAWFVHVVLVTAIAVGLRYAQLELRVTQVIQKGPPEFRPFWLPALFLLLYALAWSATWLWQLLSPGQP